MKAMSGKLVVATILLVVVTIPAVGEEVFLSDLEPITSHVEPGFIPDHGNVPVRDEGRLGKPLVLEGVKYEKGIMTHPASDGFAEAVYDVSGYKTFRADIGIDENNNGSTGQGSVEFFVYIDADKEWEEKYYSDIVLGDTPTIHLEIDISGASKLRLYVTDAGDGQHADHATWANARIDTKPLPVKPLGKLSTTWGSIKAAY